MQRRERTRQLIEFGGLVQKAGLVELVDDDRAALYGGLLALADMLAGPGGAELREVWRRRGKRTFEAEGSGSGSGLLKICDTDGAKPDEP